MPLGSRLLPFSAGVVVGAVAHAAYPKLKAKYGDQIKETLGPIVAAAAAGAGDAAGEAYAEAVRAVARQAGAVREAVAGVAQAAAANGTAAP